MALGKLQLEFARSEGLDVWVAFNFALAMVYAVEGFLLAKD
jgi:hypothetical protein